MTTAAAAAKSLRSCPTLSDPRRQPTRLPRPWDSPGKNTGAGCHVLLQCVKVKSPSHVRLFATPCTAAYQALPSMGFSRQEYWSGVPSSPLNKRRNERNLSLSPPCEDIIRNWPFASQEENPHQSASTLILGLAASRTCVPYFITVLDHGLPSFSFHPQGLR